MDDHPSSRGRALRLLGVPVVLAVVGLMLGLTTSASRNAATDGSRSSATLTTAPAPSPSPAVGNAAPMDPALRGLAEPTTPTWQPGSYRPDLPAVQEALDRRSSAVTDRDADAFVATASTRTGLAETARDQALALNNLPVAQWYLTLGVDGTSEVVDPASTTVARATYGPDVYVLHTTLRYRLEGYDRDMVNTAHLVTVEYANGEWVILEDKPSDDSREVWDFGPLTVVSGERSLVVGFGEQGPSVATLQQYAEAADIGVRDVTAVWGRDWQRRVLVVAPSTRGELAKSLDRSVEQYRQIAAVTTARLAGTSSVSRGDRVFVNPRAFAQLGPRGRTIVLRHEITHVATVAAAGDSMPTWMEEGFADHLGYRGTDVSYSAITAELRAWVLAGARPTALPADTDYDGRNGDLVETYEQSWLAANLIVRQYGEGELVSLYRVMIEETASDPEGGVDAAVRTVLGISLAEFTRAWRAEVRALGRS